MILAHFSSVAMESLGNFVIAWENWGTASDSGDRGAWGGSYPIDW